MYRFCFVLLLFSFCCLLHRQKSLRSISKIEQFQCKSLPKNNNACLTRQHFLFKGWLTGAFDYDKKMSFAPNSSSRKKSFKTFPNERDLMNCARLTREKPIRFVWQNRRKIWSSYHFPLLVKKFHLLQRLHHK